MFKGMNRKRKNQKGFSLVELIVVVAILGILAAVAVPSVIGYLDDAKINTDNANAKEIEAAILRKVAKGDISLSYSAASISAAVIGEIGAMPDAQQAGFDFYYDADTGRVKCVNTASFSGLGLTEFDY